MTQPADALLRGLFPWPAGCVTQRSCGSEPVQGVETARAGTGLRLREGVLSPFPWVPPVPLKGLMGLKGLKGLEGPKGLDGLEGLLRII